MPNYITNKLKVNGTPEQVKEVLDFINSENGSIDFNKITPMPKWIYGSDPKVTGIGREDEKKHGSENTCLEWSRKNWGTKWNAFGISFDPAIPNVIFFDTAWNGIPKLMQKLAWIFPEIEIEYSFYDEDTGYNIGQYIFKDTDIIKQYVPEGGTKEAYDLVFELSGKTPEEMGFEYSENENNYVYVRE